MANWRLAKSLEKLREQLNIAFPKRSRVSDGSIGDPAHASRVSDHNPNSAGVVTAVDITHDPTTGPDGHVLSKQLTADRRTKYVIFAGEIWKARTGKWEKYTGANRHDHHVHVSVKPESADEVLPWGLGDIATAEPDNPTLKLNDTGSAVKLLQAKLGVPINGIFGLMTLDAVKKFQAQKGLVVDGIVGRKTWATLK